MFLLTQEEGQELVHLEKVKSCPSSHLFIYHLTFNWYLPYNFVFSIQGDRGFEGPKGPRGQPGFGIKGEKVSTKYAKGLTAAK